MVKASDRRDGVEVARGDGLGRVTCEVEGHVALLTLDRPEKHNAITFEMLSDLHAHVDRIREDDAVRAVVLRGAGDSAFCAGGDLVSLLPEVVEAGENILNSDPAKRYFSDCFKPIIAAVRGPCVAGGLEMMLGTDLRIAGDDAVFGLPEVRWGLVPGAGSGVRLPRQLPWPLAMELILMGRTINARRAYEVGLVNEVVDADDVVDRAFEVASLIATNSPVAVQAAKEIAVRSLAMGPAFELEHALTSKVLRSADAREGPRAFAERRDPEWSS